MPLGPSMLVIKVPNAQYGGMLLCKFATISTAVLNIQTHLHAFYTSKIFKIKKFHQIQVHHSNLDRAISSIRVTGVLEQRSRQESFCRCL